VGSFARRGAASVLAGASTTGDLNYNGGPVLHGSAPYLVFWDPNSLISASEKSLLERYFADAAADSGRSSNVFGVDRQYTDSSGFANYTQAWASGHAITDTQPYPSSGQCTENGGYSEVACLYDSQLQAEVSRLISADGLPSGLTGDAPIYFVVTPSNVNSCFSDDATCADNDFCAYHSSYTDGASTVLYADIPTILAANDPKGCQYDGNSQVQTPNGNPVADVTIKYMSHEDNETITDPLGTAWYSDSSGNEDGDNCNFYGSFNPAGGDNPNAFAPTLGGSASSGTLYDQLINSDEYYTQTEWSNGDDTCRAAPTTSAITATFTAPSVAGTMIRLDPSASFAAGGYSSTTWSFGDGSSSFSPTGPAATGHTFTTPGTYTVTLTLVDSYGNLASTSHVVTVHAPLRAAIVLGSVRTVAGSPIVFGGSSSGGTGGSVYVWNFGDGSTGTGAAISHTFSAPGSYAVSLAVTDSSGATATTSVRVTVSPRVILSGGRRRAGSIISVTARRAGHNLRIRVKLSDAGTLGVGSRHFEVRHAGTVLFTYRLKAAQFARHRQDRDVTLRLKLVFHPYRGRSSTNLFKFTIRG
jgi:PKD repeat protein